MIHPKKLLTLDALRAIACLLVWVSHFRVATGYFREARFDTIQTFSAWGRESVAIFFILSGIVINLSTKNKTNRWEYFRKRFIRIYPIYLFVLIFCFLADHFILGHATDIKTLIGNLGVSATIQGILFAPMPLNPVVWSITCEAFFYLVFGLFYNFNRLKIVWIWFGIAVLSITFNAFFYSFSKNVLFQFIYLVNCSFLWVLGYLLYEYRSYFKVNFSTAAFCALMIPMVTRLHQLNFDLHELAYSLAGLYLIPLFLYLLQGYKRETQGPAYHINPLFVLPVYFFSLWCLWHLSNSLPTNKIIYSVLPFLSLSLYSNKISEGVKFCYHKVLNVLLFIADISYPLYLVHMPIMSLAFYFIPLLRVTGMLLAIFISITLSYLLETFLFKKLAPAPIQSF